jgi:hypothetical protein
MVDTGSVRRAQVQITVRPEREAGESPSRSPPEREAGASPNHSPTGMRGGREPKSQADRSARRAKAQVAVQPEREAGASPNHSPPGG